MTEAPSNYAVGRGKPPLHSRFQKGQSGNPSGKPGPAKLAKQRFERALYAALESSEAELEQSKPDNVIAGIARRMALDAAAGRIPAVRLMLSLLDRESGTSASDEAAEHLFTGAELFSLLQGTKQGSGKTLLEEVLWPEGEIPAPGNAGEVHSHELAASPRERNEAEPLSLVQGKKQGSEEQWLEDILWPQAGEILAEADDNAWEEHRSEPASDRNKAESFSLLQGKKQGSEKTLMEQTPAAARARKYFPSATPYMQGTGPCPPRATL